MGFFSKLFKGPEIDLEQSAANAARMRDSFEEQARRQELAEQGGEAE